MHDMTSLFMCNYYYYYYYVRTFIIMHQNIYREGDSLITHSALIVQIVVLSKIMYSVFHHM